MENYNGIETQRALENEINNDFFGLVNDVIEYVLSCNDYNNAPFTYDDIENMYVDNSEEIEAIETKIELIEDYISENDQLYIDSELSEKQEQKYLKAQEKRDILDAEKEVLECEQDQPQEVMQWFKVSGWLFRQLQERGAVVLESPNGYYWGRCSFGQSVILDSIIQDCYKDNVNVIEAMEKDNANK